MTAENLTTYSIRGGRDGRKRLRLLSRVLHDTTAALLDRAGLARDQWALDLGCGGGDVSREMARRVGASGRVVGVDTDAELLRIAQAEALEEGLTQIEYRQGDAAAPAQAASFDMVYARFLLSHLARPQDVLHSARQQLKPNGVIVVEDIDFSGHASWPDDWCARRTAELCADCMRAGGGDPNLGLRLPSLLERAGFDAVQVNVVQVLTTSGEAKRLYPETLRNVADAAQRHGLASESEFGGLLEELEHYVTRPDTLLGTPRIVQAWARRASARTEDKGPRPSDS